MLILALFWVFQVCGAAVFWLPCGNRRSQSVPFVRKGFVSAPVGSRTRDLRTAGLGSYSLFLSFLPFVLRSFLLPPYAHQLPGLVMDGFALCPEPFFFVLSLALLHADHAVADKVYV